MSTITTILNGLSDLTETYSQVTSDIFLLQFTIVNTCIVENPHGKEKQWILVDTGLESSGDFIISTAKKLFGENSKPKAIILTHGHFDHIGSIMQLNKLWNVPIYSHEQEMPYLKGEKDYPQGDPTVDEGMVAKMSPSFPHYSIDLGNLIKALPKDNSIPYMEGWEWVHTPGHTPGHISLYREKDATLIVGDAFTTTKQESLVSVLTQDKEVKGPPAYLTTDWKKAEDSVKYLASLKPSLAITSHGLPMKGEELSKHLDKLARHFEEIAVPRHGRFVE